MGFTQDHYCMFFDLVSHKSTVFKHIKDTRTGNRYLARVG